MTVCAPFRCWVISPAWTTSSGWSPPLKPSAPCMSWYTMRRQARPQRRHHGHEVACAVALFAGPMGEFVMGQVLRVDGGTQLTQA